MLNTVPLKEVAEIQPTDMCFVTCPKCKTRTDFFYGEADVIHHVWKICEGCGTILFIDLNDTRGQYGNVIFNGGIA